MASASGNSFKPAMGAMPRLHPPPPRFEQRGVRAARLVAHLVTVVGRREHRHQLAAVLNLKTLSKLRCVQSPDLHVDLVLAPDLAIT